MLNKNQKGVIDPLFIIAVALIVAVGGFLWWRISQNQTTNQSLDDQDYIVNNAESSDKASQDETNPSVEEAFVLPEGWKTVSEKGMTVSYPTNWDDVDDPSIGLVVNGEAADKIVPHGFASNSGFQFDFDSGKWTSVAVAGGNSNSPITEMEPTSASTNVKGATSTIIVYGGEGSCGASTIGIAYDASVYSVRLPLSCTDSSGYARTVDGKDVETNLDKIIESISIE